MQLGYAYALWHCLCIYTFSTSFSVGVQGFRLAISALEVKVSKHWTVSSGPVGLELEQVFKDL